MVIKTTGSLSFETDIVGEFGGSRPHSMSEYYRDAGNVTPNNTSIPLIGNSIKFSDFYGTVKQFIFTVSSSIKEANLFNIATGLGWDGNAPIVVNINPDVYIWSDNISTAGLLITSNIDADVTINNYGYIIGKGGAGGYGTSPGGNGGPALNNQKSSGLYIYNMSGGYIAGGGGGGGGNNYQGGGGGGAGGGKGGNSNYRHKTCIGGAGGAIGQKGSDGESWGSPYINYNYGGSDGGSGDPRGFGGGAGGGGGAQIDTGSSNGQYGGAAGGGGRILGSGATGGLGGDRSGYLRSSQREGGDGGSNNSVGDFGIDAYGREDGAGGGGGWGASGGAGRNNIAGGSGGAAITGSSPSELVDNNSSNHIYGNVV